MAVDLRIIFVVLLLVTGFLLFLKRGPVFGLGELSQMLLDFLILPAMVLTALVFGFLLTRTDPLPLLREMAYQLSLQQNLSFADAIPDRLAGSMEVISVLREDTDGDGFEEWVVFYRYDLQSGVSPIRAAIYDIDRGNPPVIFPYALRPPDRDYLSEAVDSRLIDFDLVDVTLDQNGPENEDLLELMVVNGDTLSLFRFDQNSAPWDFPRDTPPRYQPIGYFQGSGGVEFDPDTKNVTVIDRNGYDRSQLALRSIYALQGNSYWAQIAELGTDPEVSPILAAPIVSTVDFYEGAPTDIQNTTYPEKIVLAFYAANCGGLDDSLCRNDEADWDARSFLTGDALNEFDNGRSGYFGLPNFGGNQDISVSIIRYYPQIEAESSEPLVTGPEPQNNVVDLTFTENRDTPQTLSFVMELVEGQWKITRRVILSDPLATEPPSQISNNP